MARKKKAPKPNVVSISLTVEDRLALGMQLANLNAQIKSLKDQAREEAARFKGLIDEQIDIADAVGAQIRGGTGNRDQATMKVGETGELEVPEKPFDDTCVHCKRPAKGQKFCSAACDRCDEKSEDGKPCVGVCGQRLLAGTANAIDVEAIPVTGPSDANTLPPAVAEAIAKNGGEVDLSAGARANSESLLDLADAVTRKKSRGKAAKEPARKQPPKAPAVEPVTVIAKPTSCPDCGGKILEVDASGVYQCADSEGLGCSWCAVVESHGSAAVSA